jgi:hypothetical protein
VDERNLRLIAYISGIGGLALSAIYLFGFLGVFGLNVLQFIGFTDVLAYALFPMLALVPTMAISFAFGRLASRPIPPPSALVLFGRRYWELLSGLCLAGCLLVLRLMSEPGRTVLSLTILYFLALTLTSRAVMIEAIKAEARPLVMTACVLGLAVFGWGRLDAFNIMSGDSSLVVDTAASGVHLHLDSDGDNPVSYIGRLSDFYILYESKSAEIIILRTDKIGPLVLVKNPKSQLAPREAISASPLPTATVAPSPPSRALSAP